MAMSSPRPSIENPDRLVLLVFALKDSCMVGEKRFTVTLPS